MNDFHHALKFKEDLCIGCAHCTGVCPTGAIHIEQGHPVLNPNRCIDCGCCYQDCPVNAIYIEQDDFMEEPAKKYFRLFPGNEVRLKSAYVVKCVGCDKDADGNITAVHAVYDEESRGGNTADGRRIKATIHWVDCKTALDAEIRLYDRLFTIEAPDLADVNYLDYVNPDSLTVITDAKVEAGLANTQPEDRFQFLRVGYFCADNKDSKPGHLVFNRAVSLKDG